MSQAYFLPNKQQQAVIDWAVQGSGHANVVARAGTGKCLGKGTLVMKYDGSIVPVESVRVGDRLMGPDSEPREVRSVSSGYGKLFKITPIKGDSWICNDVHVMTLKGTNWDSGHIIDVPLNEFLEETKTKRKDKNWKLFRVPLSFVAKPTPFHPYVIGSWLGDGTVGSPEWTLGVKKKRIRNFLKKQCVADGFHYSERWDDDNNSWCVSWSKLAGYTKNVFRDYLSLECLSTEREKRIPREYLINCEGTRKSLFAALMDTDGATTTGGFEFTTKYAQLRDDVLFLARSLGFSAYCSLKKVKLPTWSEHRSYYRISISGDSSDLPLLRHKPTPRKQIKDVLKTGWDAEPIGRGKYYGFTLDGDGRFLLGDFTVTHNTATLVQLIPHLKGRVFLGAFNKSIAEELAGKIEGYHNATAGTMHSLGYYLWRQMSNHGKSTVDGKKVRNLTRKIFPFEAPYSKPLTQITVDLVSFGKQSGFGLSGNFAVSDEKAWEELAEYYDMWDELPHSKYKEGVLRAVQKVYANSLDQCVSQSESVIDFDDMILAPLCFGTDRPGMYDWVLVDEAQDSSATRRMLAKWVLKETGRLVAVGDPKQSVYGFAGATNDSMNVFKEELGSAELPLNMTYRCPKSVVTLAQSWVPDYEAHENNPEGSVSSIHPEEFLYRTEFSPDQDVILCRNTRPLIAVSRILRQRGIPCVVEGVNYKGILSLMSKWGEDITVETMLGYLWIYRDEETERLLGKGQEDKAAKIQDRVETVADFAKEVSGEMLVSGLMDRVERLLGQGKGDEGKEGVLKLCSIHRSKGREWDRVFLVGRNIYMPSKYAKSKWALEQEENLMYVGVTRAKRELVEVVCPAKRRGGPDWWEL